MQRERSSFTDCLSVKLRNFKWGYDTAPSEGILVVRFTQRCTKKKCRSEHCKLKAEWRNHCAPFRLTTKHAHMDLIQSGIS